MVLINKNIQFIFMLTVAFLISGTALSASAPADLKKILSKELKLPENEIELSDFSVNCNQDFTNEQFFKLKLKNKDAGMVVLTKAKGRYDYFNFLIWYDQSLTIKQVKVTAYFSDHGGEITGKKWLAQFAGYQGEEIEYGKEIQAISGATLSGRAITRKIEELSSKMKTCFPNGLK